MSDYDLSNVPDLLARLDGPVPCDGAMGVDEAAVIAERRECGDAIRALMAEARGSGVRLADLSKSEIEIAVAVEREACARLFEDRGLTWVAATIRARGAA